MRYACLRSRLLLSAGVVLACAVARAAASPDQPSDKVITIALRFDDYSSISPTELELKLISDLRKNRASCTFGVIPYVCSGDETDTGPQDVIPLTQAKADLLHKPIEDGVVRVALHGYSHQTLRKSLTENYSEFYGRPYASQEQLIAKGKELLERAFGTDIVTFIPPYNSYDGNTLRVLEKLGFKCISASAIGEVGGTSSISFLPFTSHLSELQGAVRAARLLSDPQPLIVVVFHVYDFIEVNREKGTIRYEDFSRILGWAGAQKDVRIRSIGQVLAEGRDLSGKRFEDYSAYCRSVSFLPKQLRPAPCEVYLPSEISRPAAVRGWFYLVLFYLTPLLVCAGTAFGVTFLLQSRVPIVAALCRYGVTAALIVFLVYALLDFRISDPGLVLAVMLLGASGGAWVAFLRRKPELRAQEP